MSSCSSTAAWGRIRPLWSTLTFRGLYPAELYKLPVHFDSADPGDEHDLTYQWTKDYFLDYLKERGHILQWLKPAAADRSDPGSPYHQTGKSTHYPEGRTLTDIISQYRSDNHPSFLMLGSGGRCTETHKQGVLNRFHNAMTQQHCGLDHKELSLPTIFLLLVILTVFKGGLVTMMVVIGCTLWMGVARLVRSEMLHSKEQEFVEAAVALGAGSLRVLRRHVLPGAYSSIIVAATLGIARAILVESALSYLGLGIQPPTASLGNMLSNAQTYLWTAPVQALWPGLLILLAVLCFNCLGDGLRDALDPRMKR